MSSRSVQFYSKMPLPRCLLSDVCPHPLCLKNSFGRDLEKNRQAKTNKQTKERRQKAQQQQKTELY